MSTLTAEEWNQRYPRGADVLVEGATKGSHVADKAWVYQDVAWVHPLGHGHTPLSEVEVLSTDDQRIAAGWLPPDEAERLKAARDNLLRNAEILADEVIHANALVEARLAAVQLVIDAARAMVAKRDAKYRARYEAEPNRGDPEWWTDGLVEDIALVRAVDALDADSPPEGPTQ